MFNYSVAKLASFSIILGLFRAFLTFMCHYVRFSRLLFPYGYRGIVKKRNLALQIYTK